MQKGIVSAAIAATLCMLLVGCSGDKTRKADYERATTLAPLEVPPDLTAPEVQGGMVLPELGEGQQPLTASAHAAEGGGGMQVLPQAKNMRVMRDGQMRWLVVQATPEQLWSRLRDFWLQQGMEVKRDEPRLGILETQWAENKADIPKDWLSKWLPKLHSAPTRDKFRLRIERGSEPDSSEIYLTHYGLEEVQRGQNVESYDTIWQTRPSDPELVSEMLNRLVVFIGVPQQQATTLVAQAEQPVARSLLETDNEGRSILRVNEAFSRSWRRVGIALDRLGLVVEDRDRSAGVYYVRAVDMIDDAGKSTKGFFSGWFSGDETTPVGAKARIVLTAQGDATYVVVQDEGGTRDSSAAATAILKRLETELR